jgi:uncharacterized Zn-binding protein involved in type VI secretion
MAQPAVQGDLIQGNCLPGSHQVPNPSSGSPQPSPSPLPFSGPLLAELVPKVTIGGKPVAVVGSSADNTPVHIGLHPSDPRQANPKLQVGKVVAGSSTVTFGGKPAATSMSQCQICGGTAKIVTTVTNVTID